MGDLRFSEGEQNGVVHNQTIVRAAGRILRLCCELHQEAAENQPPRIQDREVGLQADEELQGHLRLSVQGIVIST